jgi:hypothetical protein
VLAGIVAVAGLAVVIALAFVTDLLAARERVWIQRLDAGQPPWGVHQHPRPPSDRG